MPLSLLANTWILLLPEQSEYRRNLCALVVLTRASTSNIYMVILLFSVLFRTFLILHSDKGLVEKGQPNLNLFHKLFWLAVGSFVAIFLGSWPLAHIIKGMFILQDSNRGKACLLGDVTDIPAAPINNQMRLLSFVPPVIIIIYTTYQWLKVKVFLKGHCPKDRMACMGAYRRNALTFRMTFSLLLWTVSSPLVSAVSSTLSIRLGGRAQFWVWNITAACVYESFYFTLPFLIGLGMPLNSRGDLSPTRTDFYVRKPLVLEPRRYKQFIVLASRLIYVSEYQDLH